MAEIKARMKWFAERLNIAEGIILAAMRV